MPSRSSQFQKYCNLIVQSKRVCFQLLSAKLCTYIFFKYMSQKTNNTSRQNRPICLNTGSLYTFYHFWCDIHHLCCICVLDFFTWNNFASLGCRTSLGCTRTCWTSSAGSAPTNSRSFHKPIIRTTHTWWAVTKDSISMFLLRRLFEFCFPKLWSIWRCNEWKWEQYQKCL